MLSFKNLQIKKDNPMKVIEVDTSMYNNKPNIQYLGESNKKITLFNKPKPKIDKALARVTEPGYKIPIGQFHSISQWCETCQDVQGFAHKPEKRRMICLTCKTIKIY